MFTKFFLEFVSHKECISNRFMFIHSFLQQLFYYPKLVGIQLKKNGTKYASLSYLSKFTRSTNRKSADRNLFIHGWGLFYLQFLRKCFGTSDLKAFLPIKSIFTQNASFKFDIPRNSIVKNFLRNYMYLRF